MPVISLRSESTTPTLFGGDVAMKKWLVIVGGLVTLLAFLSGCSTLSVKAPRGMCVSTGDFVPEVETLAVLQEHRLVFAPLVIYDISKIREGLYEKIIGKARGAAADGVTNISSYWKLSPLTYLTLPIASAVLDYYVEGIAIKEK